MEYPTIVVMLALAQYIFFIMQTGFARGKYKVDAPKCSGNENFERIFRVQMNTLEQLIIFIPAAFAFSYYVSAVWGSVIGVIYIVGRFLYFYEYTTDPKKRAPGMMLTFLSNSLLVAGAIVGCVLSVS